MKTLISQSGHSLVYYQKSDEESKEVWKISTAESLISNRLAREFELSKDFTFPGFRKAIGMSEYRNKPALVLEYVDGVTLEQIAHKDLMPISDFLRIAIKCSAILEELNKSKIVHNSINSRNFIYNSIQDKLVLIDFALAEAIPFELSGGLVSEKETIEDLCFYSPELAGRFNRKIDHRSDMFSLGIVFYQLLTGQLPFYGKESSEVNYALITQAPTSIRWLNPSVPKSLEDIVFKLLAKSVDARYQSAQGLSSDLYYCLENLNNPEKLCLLEAGQKDYSYTLNIPNQLYGREFFQEQLSLQMRQVEKGQKVMINVFGEAGTGKSSLGNLVFQESVKSQSLFISGRYDSSHKGVPYFALLEAFRQLATLILASEENRLNWWKTKLAVATGSIGKVLIDLVPEFKWIIGEQPDIVSFDGIEAQSRVLYLFQRVIEVATSEGQSLVIFLDDIHFCDPASLSLIKSLISYPNIHNLLIVCTTTVSEGEKLDQAIDFQLTDNDFVHQIELGCLDKADLNSFLSDLLKNDATGALVEAVYHKTGGNPFFVHEFLKSASEKQILFYDLSSFTWSYDIEAINSLQASKNVIDLVIAQINALSSFSDHILKIASCMDDHFDASLLKDLVEANDSEIGDTLNNLKELGLFQIDGANMYRFVHDRIKQTVYDALPEDEKILLHAKIGIKYLLNAYLNSTEDSGSQVYILAKHINNSGNLITSIYKREYIDINYKAGKKSKDAGAFALAYEYFENAIKVTDLQDWDINYEFVLTLYIDAAKAASINGKRERAMELADFATERARTKLDKVKAREIYLHILTESHQLSEAVDLLLVILKDLGFPLQRKPSPFVLIKELMITKKMLWFKNRNDILNLPEMTDSHAQIFMRLTAESASSIFGAAPEVFPLIIFKQIQLSLKYGNSMYSPNGYVAYGFALSSILGNIDKGYEFGEISLELMRRYQSKEIHAKVITIFYGFLSYWKKSIRDSIEPLRLSYQTGRENGDLLYASFATSFHSSILFFSGERLSKILKLMEEDSLLIQSMSQQLVYTLSETQRQFVQNISTYSTDYMTIIGDEETEQAFLSKLIEKKDKATLFYFYVYKLLLAYWFDKPQLAFEFSQKALQYEEDTSSRQICYPYFLLFSVLAIAKYSKSIGRGALEGKVVKKTKKIIKKLKEISSYAPENFNSKYYLASGAFSDMEGNAEEALDFYSKGIQSAKNSGFIQEEAIGYELLAQCYLRKEEWSMAEVFMQKAWKCYDEWGAVNKTKHMFDRYPEFLQNLYLSSQKGNSEVDLVSIIKASQSISSEVTLDGFLSKMLQLVMEYSNVQRAAVIVKDVDDSLILKAVGTSEGIKLFPASTRNLDKAYLPISIVHYVARTKQFFMTESVSSDPIFSNDPYFKEHHIHALCCFPIVKNNELLSMIYVENSSARDVFGGSLVEFFKVLSTQIAISLENALLFEHQIKIMRLENDYNQNLLTVSHQAEENERKRIAEELHDDIGALLSTTKLYLSHIPIREEDGNVQNKVKDLLDKAIQTVRNLSHRLSPISLDRFGLESVLESLFSEISNSGVMTVDYVISLPQRLTLNQELQLYRISQELLNNAIKYSKASKITFSLVLENNTLSYEYKDNGVGFQMDNIQSFNSKGKGIGIHNVSNRVKLIKGDLIFESRLGEGVTVKIVINNCLEHLKGSL